MDWLTSKELPALCRWVVIANGTAATTLFTFTGALTVDASFIQGLLSPAIGLLVLGVLSGMLAVSLEAWRSTFTFSGILLLFAGSILGLMILYSNTCENREFYFSKIGAPMCKDDFKIQAVEIGRNNGGYSALLAAVMHFQENPDQAPDLQ